MSGFVRVLSIDGGGIRGILPAYWLAELEKELKSSLHEHFDVFVGTSTGAIIAAALAHGIGASKILELYQERGSNVFALAWYGRIPGGSKFRPKYSPTKLEAELKSQFLEKPVEAGETEERLLVLGAAKKRLLITAFDAQRHRPLIFDSRKHTDVPTWEACRASSAAPTYFPAHRYVDSQGVEVPLLDGGIAANNPATIGLGRVMKDGTPLSQVLLASFGTGTKRRQLSIRDAQRRGELGWARPIVDTLFSGSTGVHEELLECVLPDGNYFRFQKQLENGSPQMDCCTRQNIDDLLADARTQWTADGMKVQQLIQRIQGSPPRWSLDGEWESIYSCEADVEGRSEETHTTMRIRMFGNRLIGVTETGPDPGQFEGEFEDTDIVGMWRSKNRPLRSGCVLRLNKTKVNARGELNELTGYWCGIGDYGPFYGPWRLTR